MAAAAPGQRAISRLLSRIADMLAQIHGMYAGDAAHQALVARFAAAKLRPGAAPARLVPRARRAGQRRRAARRADRDARRDRDPAVVAEANRRFDANDPSVTAGPLRQTILGIVASNADAATWDRLRAMARDERNPLVSGPALPPARRARDEALARRALDLALTDEPGATNSSQLIGAVAGAHPDLAFDFALADRERVEPLVDASSRSRFLAGLARARPIRRWSTS